MGATYRFNTMRVDEPHTVRDAGGVANRAAPVCEAAPVVRETETGNPASSRTTVLIVDDHLALVECLAMVIDELPDLECVASVATLADGVAAARRLAPDVVLLDVRLPDGDGVDAIGRFRAASPTARVVILTGYTDLEVLTRAAGSGASGFLQKDSSVEAIVHAIRSARDGDILVDQTILVSILGGLRPASTPRGAVGIPSLTPRELDVLALMGEGLDPHAIARLLEISLNTCRGYEKSIMAKLHAHSQLEAVVLASRRGLLGIAS
jgi:DNA-binding NarL/FixJ family response regulator